MKAKFLACLLIGCASAAPAEILYSISSIQTSGGGYATDISSINDSGWTTGTLQSGGSARAYFSNGLGVTTLGSTAGGGTRITNSGLVGGQFTSGTTFSPFIYDGNGITNLAAVNPAVQNSGIMSLNDHGDAVLYGFSVQYDNNNVPSFLLQNYLYQNGGFATPQALGLPGLAMSINNAGTLAGITIGTTQQPFIVENGTVRILPTFGGSNLSGQPVLNEAGQLTGAASSGTGPVAFFYDGANMVNLGSLLSDGNVTAASLGTFVLSQGRGINEQGTIVGQSVYDGGGADFHAFVSSDGSMQDLNSLIAPNSGWVLNQATDINEFGQIVGTGLFNGEQRGFILTPYDTDITGQSANNPFLPSNPAGGTDFVFDAEVSVIGQQLFFDPLVATGYDYSVTGSMFTSVQFTSLLDDADGYMLYSADGLTLLGIAHIGELFEFDGPLSAFKVRGIAPQNMLDPEDPMAFVAGFTFSSIGSITLTQSSYSEDYAPGVPEPASWAMMIAGLGFAGAAMRRRAAPGGKRLAAA